MAISKGNDLGTSASSASGTTQVLTLTAGAAVGNHVVVCLCWASAVGTLTSLVDSKGNTWQTDRTFAAASSTIVVLSSKITTALVVGDTITMTASSTFNGRCLSATEWVGLDPTSWSDGSAEGDGTGTSTTPSATGAATTAQANEVVIGVVVQATATFTAGSGYTALPSAISTGSGPRRLTPEYKIVSATGTQTADGTLGSSVTWAATVVPYKAAPSGHVLTVGQATETDTAQSVGRIKVRTLGQPVVTNTAQGIVRLKRRAIGQALEADTAQGITRAVATPDVDLPTTLALAGHATSQTVRARITTMALASHPTTMVVADHPKTLSLDG